VVWAERRGWRGLIEGMLEESWWVSGLCGGVYGPVGDVVS
jgi:hypothetical protein